MRSALGMVSLLIFVLLGFGLSVLVFGQGFISNIWVVVWLVIGVLTLAAASVYVSLIPSVPRFLISLLARWRVNARVDGFIKKLGEVYLSYRGYQDNPAYLGGFMILSLLENLFPILVTYLLALAIDVEVPFTYFFILVPIVLALVRIPISLDGFGVQEGAFVFLLSLVGVAKYEAFFLGFELTRGL